METRKVTMIGIGGGGSRMVGSLSAEGLPGLRRVVVDVPVEAEPPAVEAVIPIAADLVAQAWPESPRRAEVRSYLRERTVLPAELADADLVGLVATLGGATATPLSSLIAELTREQNRLTLALTTAPWAAEGAQRLREAHAGLFLLKRLVDAWVSWPNEALAWQPDPALRSSAVAHANATLGLIMQSLLEIWLRPPFLEIPPAELSRVLRYAGEIALGVGGAETPLAALALAQRAPLLNPVHLRRAIRGVTAFLIPSDTTIADVEEATGQLSAQGLPPETVWGIYEGTAAHVRAVILASGWEES